MFLLLLFTGVPHVRVVLDYVLAHFIHPVHQQLEILPQMIAERQGALACSLQAISFLNSSEMLTEPAFC